MTSSSLHRPLIQTVLPLNNRVLRTLLQVSLGVAFIALLAQLRLQIGPVPLTGQTLGVLLVGASYGATLGGTTLLAYLLLGGLGLPFFTGGESGWTYISGSTGGYLLGFVIAAVVVGALAERGWDKRVTTTALAMLLGNILIYVPGLLWLNRLAPDWATTFQWGLTPFIAGDIIKLLLAGGLLPLAWRLLGHEK